MTFRWIGPFMLLALLLTAGCIHPGVNDSYFPMEVTHPYPTDTITEFPPDNAPSLRDTFFLNFDRGENPADYTSFCPPSYVPEGYIPYDLLIFTVWNETEPYDHRTTVGETLRYALNSTPYASWTPEMTLLEVSWSEHGYNPYEKNEIFDEDPKPVVINGCTGWIYEIEQDRLIVWTAGNATYWVHGSPDHEELLRVAQSIVCEKERVVRISEV